MDSTVLAIVTLVLGLALGVFIGHRMGAAPLGALRTRQEEAEAATKEANEKLARMAPELATMSERAARADGLATKLDTAREELAALKAERAGFEEQKRLLEESRANLLKEFENTGAKVLEAARERFSNEATSRLGEAEAKHKEAVASLLKPVNDRLQKYEEQVGSLERQRADAFSRLHQQIEGMRTSQEEVRKEAQRLGNSLTNAPKARGRWGERALQNVLEQAGLAEHTDFILEHSLETDEGRLRPDAIVNVPGQKKLVIDAKVSLNAYQAAFEADDDEVKRQQLSLHAKSMRTHVQTLGAKSYQSQFDEAPDYVVMFVPGEHFVAAALEADPDLWDFAFHNKVLLATPTNLVAIARTVAQVWRQDKMAEEAKEIGRLGGELYDRLAKVTEDLGKMGTHLGRAVSSYNDFTRSFESRVLVSARKMQDKGIEIGKREMGTVEMIEANPRPPETSQIEDRRDAAE
ncbi:DNA recombination protein RmuC [Qipengyuania flava]|uniref:DNA recombination protein RmuC n=1 Tax=Qipengyuania flava TaxID=192812 RepID=UPI001C626ACC|nr:DNA recombination protein RmuC [Qipengyuania flava]QYJ08096.1 DNA recombination protein RmuC [Qipengyuania flava]